MILYVLECLGINIIANFIYSFTLSLKMDNAAQGV